MLFSVCLTFISLSWWIPCLAHPFPSKDKWNFGHVTPERQSQMIPWKSLWRLGGSSSLLIVVAKVRKSVEMREFQRTRVLEALSPKCRTLVLDSRSSALDAVRKIESSSIKGSLNFHFWFKIMYWVLILQGRKRFFTNTEHTGQSPDQPHLFPIVCTPESFSVSLSSSVHWGQASLHSSCYASQYNSMGKVLRI